MAPDGLTFPFGIEAAWQSAERMKYLNKMFARRKNVEIVVRDKKAFIRIFTFC